MHNRTSARLTALTVFVAAGFARGALAQNASSPPDANKEQYKQNMRDAQNKQYPHNKDMAGQDWNNVAPDYRSCGWLKGRDVVNYSNETVGDVTDMIIDRGTGRVEYVVIKSGAVLGLGGRTVTVPHDQVKWDSAKERYVLNATADQLSTYPAFSPDDWKGLSSSTPSGHAMTNPGTTSPNAVNSNNGIPGQVNPGQSTSGSASYDQARTKADRPENRTDSTTKTTTSDTKITKDIPRSEADPQRTYQPKSDTTQTRSDTTQRKSDTTTTRTYTNDTTQERVNQDKRMGEDKLDVNGRPVDTQPNTPGAIPGQLNPGQSAGGGTDPNFNEWMWKQSSGTHHDPYSYQNEYATQWDSTQKQHIEGEITSVNRADNNVCIEVKTQDGATKKVALGPSWYVSGGETTLNRGDHISIDVVPMNVATSAQVNGRTIALRNPSDGATEWTSKSYKSGGQTYSAPYYQHVLLSSLKSARLDCRGAVCGTVDDVVIDANACRIAFLSIDPNENFMGIADTKRLVPYSVASIGVDNTVRLDVSKEMVVASTKTPSDLKELNGQTDSIYNAFQVAAPDYRRWRDDQNYDRQDWRRNDEPARRTDADNEPK